MKPPIILLQQRDFGQKINASFEFVVQNFKPLMIALLYIAGPPALIGGFFMGSYQSNIMGIQEKILSSDSFSGMASLYNMGTSIFFLAIFLGAASLASSLVVCVYMVEYEEGNRAITPEIIWNRLKSYIGKGIGFSIVMSIFIIIALFLFILPGIYVSVALSLMYMVMVRENLDLGDTFRRCFYLIKDKWWSTFGLVIIMSIVTGIIGYVFQIPTLVVTLSSALKLTSGTNDIWTTISGIIATVGSTMVKSLVMVAIGFQYYNLVERREGTGILGAIDNIGKTNTPRTDLREEEF